MITLTQLPDCAGLYIQSELLNTWFADYPNNEDVTITVTYNCTSQYTTDVITTETATLNLAQQRVEILPDTMGWEDALEDGIYFINVEQTNEDGSVVSETECLFVDCHTKCDIFSYLAKYPEGSALDLSHAALSYMNDCSDCKCEDGCTIFNHIIATLSDPTIKMTDCGCNKP